MRAWDRVAVAFALIAVSILPATAAAKKNHHIVVPGGRSAEFHLKASRGYSISVYANDGGQVWLTADKENEGQVSYLTHGVTSPGQIKASFGDLGSVAVRFHPNGPPRQRGPEGCRGRGASVQRGTFIGKIVFEGEQSYTTLNASRALGSEARSFKLICSEADESESSPFHWTFLSANSEDAHTGFFASKLVSKAHPVFDGCSFSASIFERERHLTIVRTVTAEAEVGAFTATGPHKTPALATVAPPAPFSGTATYEKAKGSPASWTGSLSASFPGLGVVPLTGSGWKAQLNPRSQQGSGEFTGSFFTG